jgi:hypothetical protein
MFRKAVSAPGYGTPTQPETPPCGVPMSADGASRRPTLLQVRKALKFTVDGVERGALADRRAELQAVVTPRRT